MYTPVEHEVWRQPHEELRREAAIERPERAARANRETRAYVVRDLIWEPARLLDAEGSLAWIFQSPKEEL